MSAFLTYLDGIATLKGLNRIRRGAAIILVMWLPSLLVNLLATRYLPVGEVSSTLGKPQEILFAITLYPIAETYGMRLGLFVLRKAFTNTIAVCVFSAAGWGLLHFARYWGLYVIWPFFVMSYCYLRLERNSITQAMVVSTLLHSAANAYTLLVSLAAHYLAP